MRHQIGLMGGDASRLGFASIQLDGEISKVLEKVEAWFAAKFAGSEPTVQVDVGLEALRIGIMCDGVVSAGLHPAPLQAGECRFPIKPQIVRSNVVIPREGKTSRR